MEGGQRRKWVMGNTVTNRRWKRSDSNAQEYEFGEEVSSVFITREKNIFKNQQIKKH